MNNPIKLLFIIDCYKNPYAGTEGQLLKLINGLDKKKFQPVLVVFRGSDYLEKHPLPVHVDVLKVSSLSSPHTWITLFRYFRRRRLEEYKLAHIFFNDASVICPPILKVLGYRILISRRDMGYWYGKIDLMVLRINALYVDKVVVNSNAVKDVTIKKEGYLRSKVEVIYNGYLDRDIQTASGNKQRILNEQEFNIVLVANIRPIKRIEDAIYAIQFVRASITNAALYVVGDGDRSSLKRLCRELGVSAIVHFMGPRDDVQDILTLFDVGLLCSESEGFSNALIEYSQSGLPVVCTGVGGNPEIIENGVNGFLYDVGDIEALSRHLVNLANDEQLRVRMGMTGLDKVREVYSLSNALEHHQCLYEKIVSDV